MPVKPPPIPTDVKKTSQTAAAAQPAGAPPKVAVAPGGAAVAAAPENQFALELSFWQTPFAQNVLPFITSLVLHISLILLAVLTVEVVRTVVVEARKEMIIVPEGEMVADGPEGGIPHPGLGGDPTRDAAQDKFPDVPKDSKGIAEKPGPNLIPSLMGGGGGGDADGSAIIGIGPGGLGSGGGIGTGKGAGIGSGDGDGSGVLAPFGIPGGGGGIGPKSNFIGLGGNARRIAYVCDASGSMLNMFDSLRVEMRKSIENLRPVQSFNIFFFQDEGVATPDKTGLMPATPDNKRKAYDFLDKFFPRGTTNPIPALELAFAQKPELIYLLTDGDFSGPGNQAVIDYCRNKTADGKTKINTIAFIQKESRDNPQDLEFVKALQMIAKNSGGRFRHVTEEDMGQR